MAGLRKMIKRADEAASPSPVSDPTTTTKGSLLQNAGNVMKDTVTDIYNKREDLF